MRFPTLKKEPVSVSPASGVKNEAEKYGKIKKTAKDEWAGR